MTDSEPIRRTYIHRETGLKVVVTWTQEMCRVELDSGHRVQRGGLWHGLTEAGQIVGADSTGHPPLKIVVYATLPIPFELVQS